MSRATRKVKHKPTMNPPKVNLRARVFGRLTVEDFHGRDDQRNALWVCRCDCGNEERVIVAHSALTFGLKKSCGCLRPNHRRKPAADPVTFLTQVRREVEEREQVKLAAYRSPVEVPAPADPLATWMA